MAEYSRVFYTSRDEIKRQYMKLFSRPFRYVIRSDIVELTGKKIDDFYLYQTDIIVLFKQEILAKKILFEIFKKAIQDMIVRLELDFTLMNIPFFICHSYYIFTKDEEKELYSHFKNHGNTSDPYVTDSVFFVNGVDQLYESYLENFILKINHLDYAKKFFKDQFEHSNVLIDSISHIIFYIQPYDTSTAIKKKLFWQNESVDTYDE